MVIVHSENQLGVFHMEKLELLAEKDFDAMKYNEFGQYNVIKDRKHGIIDENLNEVIITVTYDHIQALQWEYMYPTYAAYHCVAPGDMHDQGLEDEFFDFFHFDCEKSYDIFTPDGKIIAEGVEEVRICCLKESLLATLDTAAIYQDGKIGYFTPDDINNWQTEDALFNQPNMILNGQDTTVASYLINGNNYVKLRDIAYILNNTKKQFQVSWQENISAINLHSSSPYIPVGGEMHVGESGNMSADLSTVSVYLDDEQISLKAYTIKDNNYVKLDDIGKILDFLLVWDEENKNITIDTGTGYLSSTSVPAIV